MSRVVSNTKLNNGTAVRVYRKQFQSLVLDWFWSAQRSSHASSLHIQLSQAHEEVLFIHSIFGTGRPHLFQRFVVDKTSRIFGDLKLSLLYVLAKLPSRMTRNVSQYSSLTGTRDRRTAYILGPLYRV